MIGNLCFPEHDLDHYLIRQKEAIQEHIVNERYAIALGILECLLPLWIASSYAYKARELCNHIMDDTTSELISDHWFTREKTKKILDKIGNAS